MLFQYIDRPFSEARVTIYGCFRQQTFNPQSASVRLFMLDLSGKASICQLETNSSGILCAFLGLGNWQGRKSFLALDLSTCRLNASVTAK